MAVTIAPSIEALNAITARVNSGQEYSQAFEAVAHDEIIEDLLEAPLQLRVDVVTESERQLEETLDAEDRTSHQIRVYIRKKLTNDFRNEIAALKLLTREIFQRVDDFGGAGDRVQVWQADVDPKQNPDKSLLKEARYFVSAVILRVEVEAS